MPTTQTPHRTPLKRVSQGSLFALSRSGAYPDAPHGLGFLEPAMSEFIDETDALQANIERMKNLSDSLAKFNESFASWLYIMNMNALTVDWPQAPTEVSFVMAKRRAEQAALQAMAALQAKKREAEEAALALADKTAMTEATEAETTFTANVSTNTSGPTAKPTGILKKKIGKAKLTAKEKKERSLEIEKIISCLPLEFRGSDPIVLEPPAKCLMDDQVLDLVKPPDLIQARVNKCLIALVNRKVVRKDNSSKMWASIISSLRPSSLRCLHGISVRELSTMSSNNLSPRDVDTLNKSLRSLGQSHVAVQDTRTALPVVPAAPVHSTLMSIPPAEDPLLHYLTSHLMRHGHRARASKIVSNILLYIHTFTRASPLPILREAILLAAPAVRNLNHRQGGKTIVKPTALAEKKRMWFAVENILESSRGRPGRKVEERVAREMIALLQGVKTSALEKKEKLHQAATINRGNVQSRV
ncbi:hypothetical protein H0H93_015707 [Arthromyces matolae]|nr:hypothetical protein H0H93_015707 [Arthromyces matolae]